MVVLLFCNHGNMIYLPVHGSPQDTILVLYRDNLFGDILVGCFVCRNSGEKAGFSRFSFDKKHYIPLTSDTCVLPVQIKCSVYVLVMYKNQYLWQDSSDETLAERNPVLISIFTISNLYSTLSVFLKNHMVQLVMKLDITCIVSTVFGKGSYQY